MKNFLILCMAILGFSTTMFGQTCARLDVVYTGSASVSDFDTDGALMAACYQSFILNNNGITSTVTYVSATQLTGGGGFSKSVVLDFDFSSPADSMAGLANIPSFPFAVHFNTCLSGSPLASFPNNVQYNFVACGSTPPTAVPTMSQWGLILLALLTLCFGAVAIWRKQHQHTPGAA